MPKDWQIAKVIPIFKSGDSSNLSNYRPVSLTCTTSKIFEHIILKHILTFVERNNILNSNQHGFRKGLSTTTQLLETIHDLALAVDKRGQLDLIFLDFSWQMKINLEKSVFMTVTRKQTPLTFPYRIQNTSLKQVHDYKYLGVIISSDLKFPYTQHGTEKLENVQRKAVRFVYNRYRRDVSTTELLHRAGLPTISARAKFLRLKFVFLLLNGYLKMDASRFLCLSTSRNSRNKHSKHLNEYRFHIDTFRYSFFPQAVRDWNALPDDVINTTSLSSFVCKLCTIVYDS